MATQLFFTLCFCGLLATILLLLMYLFCINDYYRVPVLRTVSVVLLASAAMGALALIIFGVYGDGRDFMPDWEHNYHSWSFGIAAVGVILQMGDGILFAVEARTILRREKAEMKQHPMERNV